jgi:hypothetical protein
MPHLEPALAQVGRRIAPVVRAEALVDGVLLGWFDADRFGVPGSPRRLFRFLTDLLADLASRLGRASVEALVLEAAARVRARCGARAAARALTAGVNVTPRSSRVRARLLLEVLGLLESGAAGEGTAGAEFVVEVYRGLDPRAVEPRVLERLDYLQLLCLTALGYLEERNRFFWHTAIRRVRDPALRGRMIALLRWEVVGDGGPPGPHDPPRWPSPPARAVTGSRSIPAAPTGADNSPQPAR